MRSDLLLLVYSSKSIPSAMLNTPRAIQNSAGFTLAAVFPNKDLNMHVNPGVRPPATLLTPSLGGFNQSSGLTQPHSAGISAQATSATNVPPMTTPLTSAQASCGVTPGSNRSGSGSGSTIPQLAPSSLPASRTSTGASVDKRLLSDLNKGEEVDLGLDMDMDEDIEVEKTLPSQANREHDVDLGLDMDMDVDIDFGLEADNELESKQTFSKPMEPLSPTLPVKSLRPVEPTVPIPDTNEPTPSMPGEVDTRPIQDSPRELHTQVIAPKAAPTALRSTIDLRIAQTSPSRSPSALHQTEPTTSVLEQIPPPTPVVTETAISAQTPSLPAQDTEKAPTPITPRVSSPPATSEEFMEKIDVQAPNVEEASVTPVVRRSSPPITSEGSIEVDVQASLPTASLPSLPENTQDDDAVLSRPTESTEKAVSTQSDGVIVADEDLASILDHPMQEDTIVLNEPSTVRTPELAETLRHHSADIEMNKPNEAERPVSPPVPNVFSSPKGMHSLPLPSPPARIKSGLPASLGHTPPPASSSLPGPAPPSQSPPPLPDSPLPQEIPAPATAIKSPVSGSRAISPINSLPTVPPVPPGGGRLKLEVVIDQAEFENSKDGYFRRLTATNPDDVHPNPLLATFGFTKSFGNHLLNKRCVITTHFAKDEVKQLVLDAGGKIIPFTFGAEFDVVLVSNDLYPTLAAAQHGDISFTQADIWSFGPADFLDAKDWKLRKRAHKRSGLVSFTSNSIIKAPELFLELVQKIDRLAHWNAFLSAETIRALHNYIKSPVTPQTNKIRMFRTMNDATGLFKVRYPRHTDHKDLILWEQQQMVVRKIEKFKRWVDVQQEISKNEHLMKKAGTLRIQFKDKIPADHRKYCEREAEILEELAEHYDKTDEIYYMKRSIFVGYNSSAIRKGFGRNGLTELGYQDVETYEMEDLLEKMRSDRKFAYLRGPSEGWDGQDSE